VEVVIDLNNIRFRFTMIETPSDLQDSIQNAISTFSKLDLKIIKKG